MSDFSYQLYSSRKFPPILATLKMLADAGYTQVEGFGGLFPDAAATADFAAALKANGLTMPTTHLGLDMVESDPEGVIALAKACGVKAVFVPHLAADLRPRDGASWEAFGRRLAAAGAPLKAAGLAFGWHNHDFEFRALDDGSLPIEELLDGGKDLAVELDLAWIEVAGQDPVAWIRHFADRLLAVHVKDIAPKGECTDEDGWADVGHGTMDWPAINAALAKTGVKYLVMEHDNPSDDRRFATRSIAAANTF